LENVGASQKNRRIYKMLADFQNIGGFPKYWRISKILADSQNPGACRKSGCLTV
jgi:hypothetical protein